MKLILLAIRNIALAIICVYVRAHIDLEEEAQDFVIDIQQIIIPEYPYAFNPSVVRWQGNLLLSFRVIPDSKSPFTSWIGLVRLNEDFEPIEAPQRLYLRDESSVPPRCEDGRLMAIGETLYLVYSDNQEDVITKGGFRVYCAELAWQDAQFCVKHVERFTTFPGASKQRREKNWVPFVYDEHLFFAYSLAPHLILQPLPGTQSADLFVCSEHALDWQWGEPRGGTPALRDGEQYLGFFHSSQRMRTAHSDGENIPHYVMGAYTFSRKLPFPITHISARPIVGKKMYRGADYTPYWKPARVVFPCGFIFDTTYVWLVYGRLDHEMWVAKLDKKKLYASLKPVALDATVQL